MVLRRCLPSYAGIDQAILDLVGGQVWFILQEQGNYTGHHRGGHGGAAQTNVFTIHI